MNNLFIRLLILIISTNNYSGHLETPKLSNVLPLRQVSAMSCAVKQA